MSETIAQRYASVLRELGETPVGDGPAEVFFRLLWVRSWHDPVCVRATRVVGGCVVNASRLRPRRFWRVERYKTMLPEARWLAFADLAKRADFWTLPVSNLGHGEGALDGAQWVLEGRQPAAYNAVDWFSPGESPFQTLCKSLLDASGWSFPSGELY